MTEKSTFSANVQKHRRIVIPRGICEALEIKEGKKIIITIEKVKK